jgi:hypothetical protein
MVVQQHVWMPQRHLDRVGVGLAGRPIDAGEIDRGTGSRVTERHPGQLGCFLAA